MTKRVPAASAKRVPAAPAARKLGAPNAAFGAPGMRFVFFVI